MIGEVERKNLENERKVRAFAILAKGDNPKLIEKDVYIVPSQSDSEKRYRVEHNGGWTCTCPDFQKVGVNCKHIQAVQLFLKFKDLTDSEQDILEFKTGIEDRQIRCDRCKSNHIIKRGIRQTKQGIRQRYECKECGRRFTHEPIKHRKAETKLIALTMDLYFKGLSLRKITDTIYQFYGVKVNHVTISRWINTFMGKIKEYTDTKTPRARALSDVWHVDEQKFKTKKDEWLWVWNVMDRDSRFILANNVTDTRYTDDARTVLKKAKECAGVKPHYILTDGLQAYRNAIKKEFYSNRDPKGTQHIRCAGLTSKTNNNVIERYHGTYRERDKVMRAIDNNDTARKMMDCWRVYYNFIREHSALDGLTPANAAGIIVGTSRNRWMDLIERAGY